MCAYLPPKSLPVLIREDNGRILAGIVEEIDRAKGVIRLSNVSLLAVVGLKTKLDAIYMKTGKIHGIVEVPIERIAHWQKLPRNISLDN